ncbi:MAG: hypothetical protein ACRCZF_28025 [Gemmataceae bacterium]
MPITFACSSCGQSLRVAEAHVGKRVKCPQCATMNVVPAAETETASEAVAPPPPPPIRAVAKAAVARPAVAKAPPPAADDNFEVIDDDDEKPRKSASRNSKRRDDDDDDDDARPRRSSSRRSRDDDDDDDRPRKKKKQRSSGNEWHNARTGVLIGGIIGILLFSTLAYFAYHSEHRKSQGRFYGCIAAAVFSLVPVGRALTGTVGEDE